MAKATPIRGLAPDMPLAECARKILLGRLADVLEWLAPACDTGAPRAVHDLRIAVKRLRYGLEFLGPVISAKRTGPYLERVRALQDCLGQLTDADAFMRRLEAARSSMGTASVHDGLTGLLRRLDEERARRYEAVMEELRRLRDDNVWPDLIRDLS